MTLYYDFPARELFIVNPLSLKFGEYLFLRLRYYVKYSVITRHFRNYLSNENNTEDITVSQAIEYHCWIPCLLNAKGETKCPERLSVTCIASSIGQN